MILTPFRPSSLFSTLALLVAFVAAAPSAQGAPRRPAAKPRAVVAKPLPARVDTAPTVRVALETGLGAIIVEVDRAHAPITADNFLRYVDQKRFDGTVFYRAMRLGPDIHDQEQGLIQGGTQNDPKRILKAIAHEPTNLTGLRHVEGALSMARWAPGTATGDFSILVSPLPALDADPTQPGDNAGYAVFGHVVEGMDIVRRIHLSPTSPTLGEGHMKGQMLAPTIKIINAHRVTEPAAPLVKPSAPAQ